VHPDKNSHPQAVDGFRKVYGAFEVLLELRSQWRLLWVLGALKGDEVSLYDLEAEEDVTNTPAPTPSPHSAAGGSGSGGSSQTPGPYSNPASGTNYPCPASP